MGFGVGLLLHAKIANKNVTAKFLSSGFKEKLNSTNILPCKMITRTDPVIYGEDGPNYLAVLIANKLTAKPQVGVDYRGKNTVKSVQNEKYSAKSADFLRFLLYLCHVIDDL